MDLKQINQQITKENACFVDLLVRADVYRSRDEWEMAQELLMDAIKSLNALRVLEKRKQLYTMPRYLQEIGVTAEVVKRYANQS
ncbi:hypothetical protein LG296_01520 [Ureibacillus chungkukjangi]|uniref:hypothetical protein n=1 Tax=Ureibacillus chungkukjangi TaxID=1202712 RepID=UPI003850243F